MFIRVATLPGPGKLNTACAAAFYLFTLMPVAGAASLTDKLTPGMPHYFDSFNAGQQPWEPGQPLNIEEVFKNYQYYEIVLDRDGKGIMVNQYIRGNKTGSEKHMILPDGSLQKSEP
ncbi:MAG TPA: hypothetical protein VMW07_09845 [Gallionella sp.]|jgi:hypothetical protein|nr:hypothetical protein [Gallionella sp.]